MMLSRGRPYTLIKATTNVVFGTAILLYGYQTPTLTILFSASQISDGDTLKTNFNELLNFYQRLITSGAYNHDIELLKNDPNHIGNNLLLLWQHGVKTGDVKRIQDILRCLLVTIGSVVAAHASSRLELLSHGLLLGKQLSDLFYELLNKQLQQQKQQRNTHGNIISGMSRLTHIFEGGSYDKEVVGSNNDEKGIWLGSHEDILRTTTDVMGAIIGISIAYLNGIFMSAYMSCSIGATLITDSTLTLISELLIDPPHTSTSSTSTSITNFFVKIGFRKEENSMISSSVRVKISQYLQSPTVSIVLKSLLIAYGLSRVPFHRITFLENALLSPLLSIERSLNICLFFLKTC